MKTSMYAALFAVVATSIPVLPASATPSESCPSTLQPATTGGAVQQQLEMMARCKTESQPSPNSAAQSTTPSPSVQTTNVEKPSFSAKAAAPNDCQSVPLGGVTGGVIRQQLEASQECKSWR